MAYGLYYALRRHAQTRPRVHVCVQHVVRHGDDNMAGEPFHPGRSFVFPKKKFGKRERSCQSQWFVDYPFLHYDVEKDVVLCHTCVTAVEQHKILRSKRPDPAFVSVAIACRRML